MAIPTHPRMNMFMKTCQPAIHPLRSSAPSPPNLKTFHSAWVYATDLLNILVETKALIAAQAQKKVYQIPARPCLYIWPVTHMGVSVAVWVA